MQDSTQKKKESETVGLVDGEQVVLWLVVSDVPSEYAERAGSTLPLLRTTWLC